MVLMGKVSLHATPADFASDNIGALIIRIMVWGPGILYLK